MARQKSTFSVPLQTDILSGGNVGLSFGNGPLPEESDEEEEDIPQRRPAPALKTQVSDDGTILKVKGANGVGPSSAPPSSQRPPSPAPIRPPPPVIAPPPLPPENIMKGLDIDGIKLGEAACLVDDVSPCMLIQGDGCNEPAPTMYSPNDGTYITCTETMEYADVPYFPRDRLTGKKKKYRTSSDTLKLQRLIEYLKSTGSEAGAKLDESAQDYLNKIQKTDACKKPEFTIPHYTGGEDDWSSGGED